MRRMAYMAAMTSPSLSEDSRRIALPILVVTSDGSAMISLAPLRPRRPRDRGLDPGDDVLALNELAYRSREPLRRPEARCCVRCVHTHRCNHRQCQGGVRLGAVGPSQNRQDAVSKPHDANLLGLIIVSHLVPQHRSRWAHCLHGHFSGSSNPRGSSSPARVAAMILAARSLHSCARSASNGTKKCSSSQVSALVTVKSAGLVISRYAWYSATWTR